MGRQWDESKSFKRHGVGRLSPPGTHPIWEARKAKSGVHTPDVTWEASTRVGGAGESRAGITLCQRVLTDKRRSCDLIKIKFAGG